jgi:aconitate hydratase
VGLSLVNKLIAAHLVEGGERSGDEIALRIDQVLLQDALGTMAFLQFEAMGFSRVKPRVVVQYADHQTLQTDSRHTDDHRFLQSACRKFGAYYGRPGVGICHVVHLEQFAVPGETLLGTDSHTPHCGAVGMLAIGAGGMDVAVAMGGGPYVFARPAVVGVHLTGRLRPWCTAKDVILELLCRLTVNGGVGKAFEFTGPGVATLSLPERITIVNMGTELGHTTSVFPSDEVTRDYFARLGRPGDWRPIGPDPDVRYDDRIELDLSMVEPLVALPSQPDRVVPVGEVAGTPIQQVMVGSCTNGSYSDIAAVARLLKGRRVHPEVTCVIFPGSHQALTLLAREGHVADLLAAGALVSEATCGACPGYVHVPAAGTRSLRAFNRNFRGRSGLKDDQVYLASPEVAAASAVTGEITDPRRFGAEPAGVLLPSGLPGDRLLIVPPDPEGEGAELWKGPHLGEVPLGRSFGETLEAEVLICLGDKVSTDDIIPAGAEAITFRSNIPKMAEYVFRRADPEFVARARAAGQGLIVGGEAYGQGSSREHAAIAPMVLGVRAVLARSFARIHRANLINWGVLPLEFADPAGHAALRQGDLVRFESLATQVRAGAEVSARNATTGATVRLRCTLTPREREIVLGGGVLAHTKARAIGA